MARVLLVGGAQVEQVHAQAVSPNLRRCAVNTTRPKIDRRRFGLGRGLGPLISSV